ncbi:hypothetical protein [Hydrogenophaga sp. NFH-34]|uniref:hypothetical protein n=1 Tax=Hydrogenophaga sp. NFH-34 TaxID=2744446 RepID=UPI001F37EB70|nr:hypothetical protein [Hydrogenophaga sp. NFH-34]
MTAPMNTAFLQLGSVQSTLGWLPEGPRFDLALGHASIGGRDVAGPFTAAGMEDAIQHVEDAIAPWSRQRPHPGGLLAVDAATLQRLADAGAGPDREGVWYTDAVEQAYQRLALRATRGGGAAGSDPVQDATVLILRECLHHGGLAGLVAAAAA